MCTANRHLTRWAPSTLRRGRTFFEPTTATQRCRRGHRCSRKQKRKRQNGTGADLESKPSPCICDGLRSCSCLSRAPTRGGCPCLLSAGQTRRCSEHSWERRALVRVLSIHQCCKLAAAVGAVAVGRLCTVDPQRKPKAEKHSSSFSSIRNSLNVNLQSKHKLEHRKPWLRRMLASLSLPTCRP